MGNIISYFIRRRGIYHFIERWIAFRKLCLGSEGVEWENEVFVEI